MYNFRHYPSIQKLNEILSSEMEKKLKQAISLRGMASLAVSGGKTPIGLFQLLSQKLIDWSKVIITLVDERWLSEDHPESNTYLLKTHLLRNSVKSARFVTIKNSAYTPFDGEKEVEQSLRQQIPLPIDLLILGMGDDGHTASLFPYAENLANGLDKNSGKLVVAIRPPNAPYDRISMTIPCILSSRHIYLHITGIHKKQVLEQALQGDDSNEMPIRAVLQQDDKTVEIAWAE